MARDDVVIRFGGTVSPTLNRSLSQIQRSGTEVKRSLDDVQRGLNQLRTGAVAWVATIGGRELATATANIARLTQGLTQITGSSVLAGRELEYLRATADRLGIAFQPAAEAYLSLSAAAKGTALAGEESRRIFEAVGGAMAKLGKSAADTQGALLAIEQMISKGKVSAEELRGQLGERLPGAFGLAARAMGITTAELDKLLSTGQITAEQMLPRLAAELEKAYTTAERIEGPIAQWNRFQNQLESTAAAIGTTVEPAFTRLLALIEKSIVGWQGLITGISNAQQGLGFRNIADDMSRFNALMERSIELTARYERLQQSDFGASDGDSLAGGGRSGRNRAANQRALAETLRELNAVRAEMAAMQAANVTAIRRQAIPAAPAGPAPATVAPTRPGREGDPFAAQREELRRLESDVRSLAPKIEAMGAKLIEMTGAGLNSGPAFEGLAAKMQEAVVLEAEIAGQIERIRTAIGDAAPGGLDTAGYDQAVTAAGDTLAQLAEAQRIVDSSLTPVQRYVELFGELTRLRAQFPKVITADVANNYIGKLQEDLRLATEGMRETQSAAQDLGLTFASAFESAIMQARDLKSVLQGLAQDILGIFVRKAVTEPMAAAASSFITKAFGFADGGVMTPRGPLPLRQYAAGGIANTPQMALFGEGSLPEAYVPLPDGRRIPVAMEGGGGGVTINNYAAGDGYEARTRQGANGRTIVDIVRAVLAEDVGRGGVAWTRGLEAAYGLGRGR